MAQITFTLSADLERSFRKKAGEVYGAQKNAVGIALRDAITVFLNSENQNETCSISR